MKSKKPVLYSAKEVFDTLWNQIKGEFKAEKVDNLKIVFNEWSDMFESGSSGIVFSEYFFIKQKEEFICFLLGNGYSSGRGDKVCGSVAYVINIECENESELIKILRKKMSHTGWRFLGEAFEVIKLYPANNLIYTGMTQALVGKYLVKSEINFLYKKKIVKFIFDRLMENPLLKNIKNKKKNSKELIFFKFRWDKF